MTEGVGSICSIYQISSVTVNEFLDRLETMGYIRVDRTAGLDIIYRVSNMNLASVLKEYYETHR